MAATCLWYRILAAQQSWHFFVVLWKFSDGKRSGLQAGQSSTLLLRSHAVGIDAGCGLTLSCWNMQGLPWRRRRLDGSRCCSTTCLYLSALMEPFQMSRSLIFCLLTWLVATCFSSHFSLVPFTLPAFCCPCPNFLRRITAIELKMNSYLSWKPKNCLISHIWSFLCSVVNKIFVFWFFKSLHSVFVYCFRSVTW